MLEVLLVEDDDSDAKLTRRAFRDQDAINLHRVETGEEALNYLSASHPDLVLLDLNLPGISGHQVLERAKSDPRIRRVPIVALTSSKAEEDVLLGWNLQVAGYLNKPINFRDFQDLADKLVQWWSANELPSD